MKTTYRYHTNPLTGEVRREEVQSRPSPAPDWWHGVAPSDLARLDNRQLYTAACRLYERLQNPVGSASEMAKVSEAYAEVIRERKRRLATLR